MPNDKQRTALNAKLAKLEVEYEALSIKSPFAYSYQIKKPKSFVSLVNNHLRFASAIDTKYKIKKYKLESALDYTAGEYFDRRYYTE